MTLANWQLVSQPLKLFYLRICLFLNCLLFICLLPICLFLSLPIACLSFS
jgi:hypothetical protein